jgi:hypothetical protein
MQLAQADSRHPEGTIVSTSEIGWHVDRILVRYSLKLSPLRVALQRASIQTGSGMALTCRSRFPFRDLDAGVMAFVSVFMLRLLS